MYGLKQKQLESTKIQTMHTILIIEDEPRVASLLKNGLEENGYQTMVAYDGVMGLRLFRVHTFDLVISDIILPKMDGFELCKEIRKTNPGIPILMLTALGSTDDKLDGFDAGADDYMVKPFDFRELYARIRVLLKRNNEAAVPQLREIRYSDLYIDLQGKNVTRNGTSIKLSPKEYNLLLYMTENAERVLSRIEIAERFGRPISIPGPTLSTYTSTISAKDRQGFRHQTDPYQSRYGLYTDG